MYGDLQTIIENQIGDKIEGTIYGSGKVRMQSGRTFYLKTGSSSRTYSCEANGLKELAKAGVLRIADVITYGDRFILTEYIGQGLPSSGFQYEFGRKFARMHRCQGKEFGFYENNFIGANPQLNIPDNEEESNNWITFYLNKRLLYQYRLAEINGYVTNSLKKGFRNLEQIIYKLLKDCVEPPSLLHGDLWSGNYLCDINGNATLIDPAVYYGHREADLAMTKVFGGFSPEFYKGYMDEYPLSDGWEEREGLYKLYHILNHLNIFGRSYLSEAEYILRSYS